LNRIKWSIRLLSIKIVSIFLRAVATNRPEEFSQGAAPGNGKLARDVRKVSEAMPLQSSNNKKSDGKMFVFHGKTAWLFRLGNQYILFPDARRNGNASWSN
jgi:hypothetical protein